MYRSFAFPLTHLTAQKRCAIAALLESYRGAVRFYLRSLWVKPGKLDKTTLARLRSTRLSERFKSQALKQATETTIATKRGAKELGVVASCPGFSGSAELDAKFVDVESSNIKTFDLVVRLSTLVKRERIAIPIKATTPLREALAVPGASLLNAVNLSEDRITLLVELPDVPLRTSNPPAVLGLDAGYHTLIATSEGQLLGTDFGEIAKKIRRRKPGSKGKKRALLHRDAAVGESVNKLPFDSVDAIGVEDLKGIKTGKRPGQSKRWRGLRASWPARAVLERLKRRAAERGIRLVSVDPKNTSRTCPQCRHCAKENREKNVFRCVSCGYVSDADVVGAINVRAKALSAIAEEAFDATGGESAVAAVKNKKEAKKASKNNRRGVAFSATTAVASTKQSDQGDRVAPGRKSKSGPRGADQSRSDSPASRGRGGGGDAVRGRQKRSSTVRSPRPLRSVESLGRRQPPGKTGRGG